MVKTSGKTVKSAILALTMAFNAVTLVSPMKVLAKAPENAVSTNTIPSVETRTFNNEARDKSIGQVGLIQSGTESLLAKVFLGIDIGMTNFNYFLEHGDMKFQGPFSAVTIDFDKEDKLNESLKSAIVGATYKVRQSDEYQALMEAEQPTLEQRYAYELVLADAAFDEIENDLGLRDYRVDKFSSFEIDAATAENTLPDNNLNNLSEDMTLEAAVGKKFKWGLECEKMSALKGLVMQAVENKLLLAEGSTFKTAGSYFNALGYQYSIKGFTKTSVLDGKEFEAQRGAHAYITSSKSGAVFEATANTTAAVDAFYIGSKSARMLLPVLGTLSSQTEINENFESLTSGMRVFYAPMDTEQPGRMRNDLTAQDITAYQVGSNDNPELVVDRLNAMYSGEFEELDDLTSGHIWDDEAVASFKGEIKSYEFYYRMYQEQRFIEYRFEHYDPEQKGAEQFVMDYATAHKWDLQTVSNQAVEAYQEYVSKGKEIPLDQLQQIADLGDVPSELVKLNIALQGLVQEFDNKRKDVASLKEKLEKNGVSSYLVSPLENYLNSDRVADIEQASKLIRGISQVYSLAYEHKMNQVDKNMVAVARQIPNMKI